MKVYVKQDDFVPFEVTIRIEGKAELYNLLARLNLNPGQVNSFGGGPNDYPSFVEANYSANGLWDILDDIAKEKGLLQV